MLTFAGERVQAVDNNDGRVGRVVFSANAERAFRLQQRAGQHSPLPTGRHRSQQRRFRHRFEIHSCVYVFIKTFIYIVVFNVFIRFLTFQLLNS